MGHGKNSLNRLTNKQGAIKPCALRPESGRRLAKIKKSVDISFYLIIIVIYNEKEQKMEMRDNNYMERGIGNCQYAKTHQTNKMYFSTWREAQALANMITDHFEITRWKIDFSERVTTRLIARARVKQNSILMHNFKGKGMNIGTLVHEVAHRVGVKHDRDYKIFHEMCLRYVDKLQEGMQLNIHLDRANYKLIPEDAKTKYMLSDISSDHVAAPRTIVKTRTISRSTSKAWTSGKCRAAVRQNPKYRSKPTKGIKLMIYNLGRDEMSLAMMADACDRDVGYVQKTVRALCREYGYGFEIENNIFKWILN